MIDQIIEQYPPGEILTADGFDDAVLGMEGGSLRLIYSISKCIEILVRDHGMEQDEAREYFEFNTLCAYVGEKTPIWCDDDY
jgi:hypothetical protein